MVFCFYKHHTRIDMNFNSFEFLIFLPVVFSLYWFVPHKIRWVLLLISSYYFYMSWNAVYVILIFTTTFISYISALLIERSKSRIRKKFILAIALIICLGILFFFKYFNFFSNSITAILKRFSLNINPVLLKVLLPVGISFYTFQTLSYVLDVYKGKIFAERHFGIYAVFVSFFPQLVAGPIERTENLLPQIKKEHYFDYTQATYGLKQMAWGYFKKLCIADVLSTYVDTVYSSLYQYKGIDLIWATLFFTIQIYCDFSGYSDIAIGVSKLMGIDLMINFKSPYFSASIKEFWRRWHISLSTWFKDYVYIPLGGNRCKTIRRYFNLFITFIASGLWHGASWTFVIWGALHGAAQIFESIFDKWFSFIRTSKIGHIFSTLAVFVFCNITWIFFRANSFHDALYVLKYMFSGCNTGLNYLINNTLGLTFDIGIPILISIIILTVFDFFSLKIDVISWISKQKLFVRWTVYILFSSYMIFTARIGSSFIYFQF